jgi:hypothetical protein
MTPALAGYAESASAQETRKLSRAELPPRKITSIGACIVIYELAVFEKKIVNTA